MNRRAACAFAVLALLLLSFGSCYYDRESDLYVTPACDTTNVTWTGVVKPIIDERCAYVGCHGGGYSSGNHDLTHYAGVLEIAKSGALVGSIEHQSNYTSMPYQAAPLPDCMINQIRIWVNKGAPQD
jgi:hypothetical protein